MSTSATHTETAPNSVLITGAARGIGRSVAQRLVRDGWTAGLIDVLPTVHETAAELGIPDSYELDLRDVPRSRATVARFAERHGGLAALVNCAGTCHRESFAEATPENWEIDIGTNLTGLFFLCQAAVFPHMRDQEHGRIVNVASVSGKVGGIGPVHDDGSGGRSGAAYAASKAGVINVTRWIAREVAKWGITANSIAPGPIDSAMIDGAEYDLSTVPAGRMGRPDEIASAAAYLLSSESGFVNGTVLHVDGGTVLA